MILMLTMALLSEEQTEQLWRHIRLQGIEHLPLAEELLDHLCCHIEAAMDDGQPFDQARREALAALAPAGLHEIQELHNHLITLNPQTSMKKAFFLVAFATAFTLANALLFRQLHWPGADYLMLTGALLLLLGMPISAVLAFRQPGSLSLAERSRVILGLVAGTCIATGALFKFMYWPGANMSFMVGMLVLNLGFFPLYFYQLYQRSKLSWS